MDSMLRYAQYMYSYPHKTAYRTLEGVLVSDYRESLKAGENSLYFHIPFCERKCGYCNLFSVTGRTEEQIDAYLDACERQAGQYRMKEIPFSNLTIGGGTPLLLTLRQLERLFSMAGAYFSFSAPNRPAVIETAPNQTSGEKLELLRQFGVTRVSIGVQSFCQRELDVLRRGHSVKQVYRALEELRRKRFPCINLDLIYGIPNQTKESFGFSLREAAAFEPEEIFCYPLYIKPGTRLYTEEMKQNSAARELYDEARNYLRGRGYSQVSMRRFVRKDCLAAQTENRSCGFENTIAIGCGGRSYIGNLHFSSPYGIRPPVCGRILADYQNRRDYNQVTHGYLLSEKEQKRRYVIKNLFFFRGLNQAEYRAQFQGEVKGDFPMLWDWMEQGYLEAGKDVLTLTEEGMALSDRLGPQLISDVVRKKMETWRDGDGKG